MEELAKIRSPTRPLTAPPPPVNPSGWGADQDQHWRAQWWRGGREQGSQSWGRGGQRHRGGASPHPGVVSQWGSEGPRLEGKAQKCCWGDGKFQ